MCTAQEQNQLWLLLRGTTNHRLRRSGICDAEVDAPELWEHLTARLSDVASRLETLAGHVAAMMTDIVEGEQHVLQLRLQAMELHIPMVASSKLWTRATTPLAAADERADNVEEGTHHDHAQISASADNHTPRLAVQMRGHHLRRLRRMLLQLQRDVAAL